MTKFSKKIKVTAILLIVAMSINLTSCSNKQNGSSNKSEIDSLKNQITQLTSADAEITKHLVKFDTLDYTVFSNQQWVRFHESHSKDIIVHWPDGHSTTGLQLAIDNPGPVGFSINCGRRNIGGVGRDMKMSKSGTPYRGTEAIGFGGTFGNFHNYAFCH